MAISFECPSCQKSYKVKDDMAGKKAACRQCQAVMTVPRAVADPAQSQALESLASDCLSDQPAEQAAASEEITLECAFCFETVKFPVEKGGKQAPCPSCRKLIRVPAMQTDKPKSDWRAVEHNFTMARKDDQEAPEGAWGATQNQSIVSREALLEARVIRHRKELAGPNRKPLYISLAVLTLALAGGGGWHMWNRTVEGRRVGLALDAAQAADPKTGAALPDGWRSVILTAVGEFYLRESPPDLKAGVNYLRQARSEATRAEPGLDRAGLLHEIALAQSKLIGDQAAVDEKRALNWEEAQRELVQTLQQFKELPRENGWQVIEDLTRRLGAGGADGRPAMAALAPVALPSECDRAEALACVALVLQARGDPAAVELSKAAEEARAAAPDMPPSPRLVALLVASKATGARQLLPEPGAGEPGLPERLAYTEGYARAGEVDKGRKVALSNGAVEHQVAALALFADAVVDIGQPDALEEAVHFAAEKGAKYALPAWALDRLGRACRRAQRPQLAVELANAVTQRDARPWVALSALRAQLDTSDSPAEAALADRVGEKTAAQALAYVAIARHNARHVRVEPRETVVAWPVPIAQPPGLAGSALGLQDRLR